MASTTLAFDILTKYKDRGADKAAKDMDKVSRSSHRMSSSLKKAALTAGAGVSFYAVGKALVGMTQNAIQDDAAQRKLAIGIKNATGATDKQVASVEKWITKQGVALGVTDDELRPAYQRLVQATGDIGKAQRLAAIAMDASAGSGKSLKTVTEAIAKAQNGNMGSLSRLGIKIKDNTGKTLSFDQAMKGMSKTFAGQASAKAGTLEGKMARLNLRWDEAKEGIGYKLIPVVTKLADFIMGQAIPAVSRFSQQMKDGEGDAGRLGKVLKFVGDTVVGTAKFLNEHRSIVVGLVATYVLWKGTTLGLATAEKVSLFWLKAHTVGTVQQAVVSKTVMVATKLWTAATWALGVATKFALGPVGLIIIGITALIAVAVLVEKKTGFFSKTWKLAWGGIKTVFSSVFNFIKAKWPLILAVIAGPMGLAVLAVVRNWGKIKNAARDATRWVVDKVLWMAEKVLDGAVAAFGWAPKIGDQLKKARDKVHTFRDNVNKDLSGIKDEPVKVTVKGVWIGGVKMGAPSAVTGHKAGGPIRGGTPGRDSVLAALEPNEHVLTVSDVKKAGGHRGVFAIRRMLQRGEFKKYGDVPAFAAGGPVFGLSASHSLKGAQSFVTKGALTLAHQVQKKMQAIFKALGGAGSLTPSQIARGQRFVRGEVGDPYRWGGVGPYGYDCSGIVSATLNAALGQNPYRRRGSTGTMPWAGFKPGMGSFTAGWYTGSPGHMAGRIGGLPFESAGGVGVRIGQAATSVRSFPRVAHYDQGGMLQPGWTLAYNGTGRPEPVGDKFLGVIEVVIKGEDGRVIHRKLQKVRRETRRPLGLE